MGRKDNRPSLGAQPPGERPRLANDPDSIGKRQPVWRVQLMDWDGPFGWEKAAGADFKQIFDRLKSFESMTWMAIEQTAKSCGAIEVAKLSAQAQQRLTAIGRDDHDVLYKLRITQRGRVWGVRMEHVLHLLWWDPEHRVYPMNIADN